MKNLWFHRPFNFKDELLKLSVHMRLAINWENLNFYYQKCIWTLHSVLIWCNFHFKKEIEAKVRTKRLKRKNYAINRIEYFGYFPSTNKFRPFLMNFFLLHVFVCVTWNHPFLSMSIFDNSGIVLNQNRKIEFFCLDFFYLNLKWARNLILGYFRFFLNPI